MNKYIVLSVNDNVDYLYFTPLTCWAWRKFGWEPIVFYNGKLTLLADVWSLSNIEPCNVNWLESIEGYRSDTITQISRLYAAAVNKETCYIMSSDIDMLPLYDYWKPDPYKITVYGHDLTGYGHYPICYIGMGDSAWGNVMRISHGDNYNTLIKRDLDTLPQAKDPDFYKYWFSDQDLITKRLNEYGKERITFINRGQYSNGFAVGRVDRGAWSLDHEVFIDAHLEQQTWQNDAKVERLYALLAKVWPHEDFTWFKEYSREFSKLAV